MSEALRPFALSSLRRGAAIALMLQVVGLGLSYVLNILLARWLGTSEYGTYAYVMVWAGILATLAGFGVPEAALRFTAQYRATAEWALLRGFMRRQPWLILGSSVVVAGLAGAALVGLGGLDRLPGSPRAFQIGLVLVPVTALANLAASTSRGLGRIGVAYGPAQVGRPLLVLAGVASVAAAGRALSSDIVLAMVLVSAVVVLVFQLVLLAKVAPAEVQKYGARYRSQEWLRVALPLCLTSSFMLFIQRTDIVLVGIYLNPDDVALYSAASKTVALVAFFRFAVNARAAPEFAALWARGKAADLQRLTSTLVHWSFWPSLAGVLVIVVFGREILGLFGPEFEAAHTPLAILALAQLFNAGAGPVGSLLNLTGHQDRTAFVLGCSAVVNLVLNLSLIPSFGMTGAALATATTTVIWNVWLHALAVHHLKVRGSIAAGLRSRPWARR